MKKPLSTNAQFKNEMQKAYKGKRAKASGLFGGPAKKNRMMPQSPMMPQQPMSPMQPQMKKTKKHKVSQVLQKSAMCKACKSSHMPGKHKGSKKKPKSR